jgi:hypothetical protein
VSAHQSAPKPNQSNYSKDLKISYCVFMALVFLGLLAAAFDRANLFTFLMMSAAGIASQYLYWRHGK